MSTEGKQAPSDAFYDELEKLPVLEREPGPVDVSNGKMPSMNNENLTCEWCGESFAQGSVHQCGAFAFTPPKFSLAQFLEAVALGANEANPDVRISADRVSCHEYPGTCQHYVATLELAGARSELSWEACREDEDDGCDYHAEIVRLRAAAAMLPLLYNIGRRWREPR